MPKDLATEIALAQRNIDEAEHALEKVLAEIAVAPRADKVTVSRAVEEAFDRLRAAHKILAEIDLG
jgi:hypothetical protein